MVTPASVCSGRRLRRLARPRDWHCRVPFRCAWSKAMACADMVVHRESLQDIPGTVVHHRVFVSGDARSMSGLLAGARCAGKERSGHTGPARDLGRFAVVGPTGWCGLLPGTHSRCLAREPRTVGRDGPLVASTSQGDRPWVDSITTMTRVEQRGVRYASHAAWWRSTRSTCSRFPWSRSRRRCKRASLESWA